MTVISIGTRRSRTSVRSWIAAVAVALSCGTASAQVSTKLVSIGVGGAVPDENCTSAQISGDGRYVLFESRANKLVPGDQDNNSDVFLVDRLLATFQLVSLAPGGAQIGGGAFGPSLAPDGRHAAFTVVANLGQGLLAGILVHDLDTGLVEIVNLGMAGEYPDVNFSVLPDVTPGGRFVAFVSAATNLVAGDTNMAEDIFVRDRLLGVTERVSVGMGGAEANGYSFEPSISDDGLRVAFESAASNLVPGDTNSMIDVFVYDRSTGTTRRVSVTSGGDQAASSSRNARISGDGRYVAFESSAQLVPPLVTGNSIFVHDLLTSTTVLVSCTPAGVPANTSSNDPTISRDGRFVGFSSEASNLVAGDTNGLRDSFVKDRSSGGVERVSISTAGQQGNGHSLSPSVSDDGVHACFGSASSNLAPGDANGVYDVFVRGAALGDGPWTYCVAKANSAGCLPAIGWTGSPTLSGPDDFVTTAVEVLNNKVGLFFWGQAPNSAPLFGGTLCITSQIERGAPMGSGGSPAGVDCTGSFQNAFTQSLMASMGYTTGQELYGQFWYRDPGFASPNDVGLTDALEFTILD